MHEVFSVILLFGRRIDSIGHIHFERQACEISSAIGFFWGGGGLPKKGLAFGVGEFIIRPSLSAAGFLKGMTDDESPI